MKEFDTTVPDELKSMCEVEVDAEMVKSFLFSFFAE